MNLPNIYEFKNYKMLAALPIALLLISLYFIPHIALDSSLRGGIDVQLQTNATVNVQALTAAINANITGAQTSISQSPGGISVTIATNASLASAQNLLINAYDAYGNYTVASVKVAQDQNILKSQSNATVQAALTGALANQSRSLNETNAQVNQILTTLKPLLGNQNYAVNATDPAATINTAKNAYTNASANYKTYVISKLQKLVSYTSYSYAEVTPTLGAYFLGEMQGVLITSFILVAIAVFFIFRTPIPSFAVVFGAANDIIVALGAMGLFGIPLGVASIGGLLMLIGYSIDTDMLAAIRILKRDEETPTVRAFSALKTGVTMTTAAIISFAILLIIAYLTFIPTYFEIASVVLFGLIADLFTTWCGSTVMVVWYKLRKDGARK